MAWLSYQAQAKTCITSGPCILSVTAAPSLPKCALLLLLHSLALVIDLYPRS